VVGQAKKHNLQAVNFTHLPRSFDAKQFETATLEDTALQVEILGLFDEQLKAMQDKLVVGRLDPADCKFVGHTLRGSAAAVGALEIEALALSFEKSSDNGADFLNAFSAAIDRFRLATEAYRKI
jgi:hypothetical protein